MKDLVIGEAHDRQAGEPEPVIASAIVVLSPRVGITIDLDNETSFFQEEVGK